MIQNPVLRRAPNWWRPLERKGDDTWKDATRKWILYCIKTGHKHITNMDLNKYLEEKTSEKSKHELAMDMVLAGVRPNTIIKKFPSINCKSLFPHYRPRDFETECIYIYGPARSGKSRAIYSVLKAIKKHYGWTHYNKLMKFESEYWEGYNNDKITYVDDPLKMDANAYPERKILSLLKTLLDTPCDMPINVKYGSMQFMSKILIITSNHDVDDYVRAAPGEGPDKDALLNRMSTHALSLMDRGEQRMLIQNLVNAIEKIMGKTVEYMPNTKKSPTQAALAVDR